MKWGTPAYRNVRFGFEVTLYINSKSCTWLFTPQEKGTARSLYFIERPVVPAPRVASRADRIVAAF